MAYLLLTSRTYMLVACVTEQHARLLMSASDDLDVVHQRKVRSCKPMLWHPGGRRTAYTKHTQFTPSLVAPHAGSMFQAPLLCAVLA